MTASRISLQLSTSRSPPPPPQQSPLAFDIERYEQERSDREQSQAEMRKTMDDLNRRIHDQRFAREILQVPEEQWRAYGDHYQRPYGEGSTSSSAAAAVETETFRVYFKGLVSEERIRESTVTVAGIGVVICDSRDNLISELRKPLKSTEMSREAVEIEALIEGLNAAHTLNLKSVAFLCDDPTLYQYFTGQAHEGVLREFKITTLCIVVLLLQKKFMYCRPFLVPQNDVRHAFKLARDAILSQITWPVQTSHGKIFNETCVICLEDTDVCQMFSVDGCLHRYCFSCTKQHVEVKLLHGVVPKCPHEGCKSELNADSCRKVLTPQLIEIMRQRAKETAIPVTERVYCPFPTCSVLMSKSEALEYSKNAFVGVGQSGARKCINCHGFFCINCKVPWHGNMTCCDYKRLYPYPRAEDAMLKSLATRNLWHECVKCSHMIELAGGCYHITCRCGYQFCYTCGAEWKNKEATCTCPIWDERYIINH